MARTKGSLKLTAKVFRAIRTDQELGIPPMVIRSKYGYGTTTQQSIRKAKTWPKYVGMKAAKRESRQTKQPAAPATPVTQLEAKALRHDIDRLDRLYQAQERRTDRIVKWLGLVDKRASRRLLFWRSK